MRQTGQLQRARRRAGAAARVAARGARSNSLTHAVRLPPLAASVCTHPASKMATPYSTMTFSAHRWQYVCGHALQRTLCLRRLPHLRARGWEGKGVAEEPGAREINLSWRRREAERHSNARHGSSSSSSSSSSAGAAPVARGAVHDLGCAAAVPHPCGGARPQAEERDAAPARAAKAL